VGRRETVFRLSAASGTICASHFVMAGDLATTRVRDDKGEGFAMLRRLFIAAASLALLAGAAVAQDRTGLTDDTIKIGVPGPFTGDNASFSKAQIGIIAYYNWVNDNGGINGRKIEAIRGDYACNEARGIAVAKRFIHQDKVFLMHGNSCSGVALAMKPTVVEAGIPWVIGHAVNQKLATPPEKNIFQVVVSSHAAGVAMAKFAMSRPDTKNIVIVEHTNEWARGYRDPAVETLKERYKVEPSKMLVMERGANDATAQVLQIKAAKPDLVMAILYEPEMAIFLRDAQKYGVNAPVLTGYGADIENTAKRVGEPAAVKNFFALHMFKGTIDGEALKPWADMIKKYFPEEQLTQFSFASIGSAVVVVEALKRAGRDLSREKFVAEMEKFRDFDTGILAGRITLTPESHASPDESAAAGFVDNKVVIFQAWNKPF
jgi:branched-chain amino acid transport system substrate-binding protein